MRIRPYNQNTEVGNSFFSNTVNPEAAMSVGRGIAQVGQAVSQVADVVQKRNEQTEISDATVKLSKYHAEQTNKLNELSRNGTLNTEKFLNEYDEGLNAMGEAYGTRAAQDYLKRSGGTMKSHFMESSVAAQTELAAVKSRQDYKGSLNNWSSSLMKDPSAYNNVLAQHTEFLNENVRLHKLSVADAEKLKTAGEAELAKGAIRGWIDLDPADAERQLKSGQWDKAFDTDVKKQLLGEAKMGINAQRLEAERLKQLEKEALAEAQRVTQNTFLEKMVSGDLSPKDIVNSNLEPFGSGSKAQFLSMFRTTTNDSNKIKTDSGTYAEIFKRIHLPEGDPNKLVDENELNGYLGNGLTLPDIKNLRGEMQGRGTQAGKEVSALKTNLFNAAKSALTKTNPMMGIKDPSGDEQLARFTTFFQEEYNKKIKEGVPVKDLLNPDSKEYLGKHIRSFSKTPQQIMKETIELNRQPKAPADPEKVRKPGETISQWIRRTQQ